MKGRELIIAAIHDFYFSCDNPKNPKCDAPDQELPDILNAGSENRRIFGCTPDFSDLIKRGLSNHAYKSMRTAVKCRVYS